MRENARQASGSGVGLLQAGWDVSAGVKESPDVDRGFALQVEQQVRELADRHDPQVRNGEFVREAQRSKRGFRPMRFAAASTASTKRMAVATSASVT